MGEVPPSVTQVLQAAHRAESAARGAARRDAFRVTRHLIAGALAAGLHAEDLAVVLGVTTGSVSTRGNIDGLVPGLVFAGLSGVDLDTLTRWQHCGLLPAAAPDHAARTSYPASALLQALMTTTSLPVPETA